MAHRGELGNESDNVITFEPRFPDIGYCIKPSNGISMAQRDELRKGSDGMSAEFPASWQRTDLAISSTTQTNRNGSLICEPSCLRFLGSMQFSFWPASCFLLMAWEIS